MSQPHGSVILRSQRPFVMVYHPRSLDKLRIPFASHVSNINVGDTGDVAASTDTGEPEKKRNVL